MNDLRTVLSRAADGADPSEDVVTADLARAKRARHRRMLTRTAGAAAAGVAVAVFAGALPDAPHRAPVVAGTPDDAKDDRGPRRNNDGATVLVAYTGDQPEGYRVESVPDGWEIQGTNEFRMTIAPIGAADRHPDSFVGKLVVLLESADASGRPPGEKVRVGESTGYLNTAEETAALTYDDGDGHRVVIQVPPALGWSQEQIVDFALGVTVTQDAVQGRG
jgi:hypothetical protein